jgi:hypothetical protein
MLKIIKECKNPDILIITPLLTGHTISRETKISIKRNDVPYIWASYTSENKHAYNCQAGIDAFYKQFKYLPRYIFILDRDIICDRGLLDKFYKLIKVSNNQVAYVYCGFEYKGHINLKIPATIYNVTALKLQNYISSNSLYKTDALLKIGGFVTDEKYHRLSDWCFFLKAASMGYKGILCTNTSFIAISTKNDISAGSYNEYKNTKELVIKDFVEKI